MTDSDTFVITLDPDVAEYLDIQVKNTGEMNQFINQTLIQQIQKQKGNPTAAAH